VRAHPQISSRLAINTTDIAPRIGIGTNTTKPARLRLMIVSPKKVIDDF
jgi:hypothetical protein